jgi:hypothetical protein
MFELQMKMVLDRTDDRLPSRLRTLLREVPQIRDHKLDFSRIGDYPSITCFLYIDDQRFQGRMGRELLSMLSYIRSNIESTGIRVLHIIVDEYDPPFNLMRDKNGLWAPQRMAQIGDFLRALIESGAQEIGEWLFLPFHPEAQRDDSDYELCPPDEKLQAFGRRINGSPKRVSVPVSLKIRLEEGRRLSEYVSATFGHSLESFPSLGGENVMLTTVLQMNDRLDMVNHYSEKLERAEALNLYSLSAMNLSLADVRDETNIAVLTSLGKLILEDIKLGG